MSTMPASPLPPRISRPDALAQLREARFAFTPALEAAEGMVAVLNAQRQVIYATPAFQELSRAGSVEEMCGARPGELLGCSNARGACGESEACGFCGAAQAIRETIATGSPFARECHITVDAAEHASALDLLVQTTPFRIGEQTFVLARFSDISHQKRRAALERIFFHDILNTASSFKVYLDLLARRDLDAGGNELLGNLTAICETLVEEIQGQRIMLNAETGTLQVQKNLIDAHALAREIAEQMRGLEVARGRSLHVAPFSEPFSFVSDDALVKRVLANMIKNGLEAAPNGATVTVGFRARADGTAQFQVHNPGVMEPTVQRRIFARYFSTKGEGRGLGTWGMRLLAEDYLGGRVEFISTFEQGTIFTLTVPLKPLPR